MSADRIQGACTLAISLALTACGGSQPSPTSSPEPRTAAPAPLSAASDDDAAGPAADEAPAPQAARLTFADALSRAQARHPGAPAIEVEVETEDGGKLLEVEFLVDGEIQEVYLHPTSGEVVREQTEEIDDEERATLPKLAELLGKGEVTLSKAIDLALERHDETTIHEIELEMHDEDLILEVAVAGDDGKVTEWVLDPKTGAVLGEETDDETHAVEPPAASQ